MARNKAKNKNTPEEAPIPANVNPEELEKIKQELAENREDPSESVTKMSDRFKAKIAKELNDYRRREKTRLAEMMSIFSAHNFYANGFTPVELRTTLEDLGPTYVKIGQIMSSRTDLLPESYCKELEKLRQTVKPLDSEIARAVIEEETGKTIDELYSEFRDEPLGSASIGQAHYCVLKDGTPVVTKVQRPLIADMMHKDYELLKKLGGLLGAVSTAEPGEDSMDLVSIVEELEKVTDEELDFRIEAANTKFFKENCIEDENVVNCPTVIDELTTERIFTMTFVDGYSVSKKSRLVEEGYDPSAIGAALVNNFVHQVLDVGTFHADPHQGNIMVSHGVPYWIDFGMVGHVSNKDIDSIQNLVLALLDGDAESLVSVVMGMGAASPKTNRDKLAEDARVMLEKYAGTTGISDMDITVLFTEIGDLASKHNIKMPGQYTMLVRSLLAIEGVIEQLCPELNLFEILSTKLAERMKNNFNLKNTLLDVGKELLSTGKRATKIPGLVAETLNGLSKGKTKINFELTGFEEPAGALGDFTRNLVLIVIACVLFIGSCMLASVPLQPLTSTGMPLIALAIMLFSIGLGIFAVRRLMKKKK